MSSGVIGAGGLGGVSGAPARVHAAVTGVLVQTPAPPPGDPAAGRGEEFGKTSPLALVVILLLALATILLIRSMNKRLRNVPASFDEPEPPGDVPPDTADDSTDPTTSTSELGRTDGPPRAGSP